ncbi:MAG: outer membrane beta-barrel protein [Saprospiraceae bacterium]
MKKVILALCLILPSLSGLMAQTAKWSVSGTVVDKSAPLVGATVTLLHAADSVLAGFATTDTAGKFTIGRLKKDNYLLNISYIGYEKYAQAIDLNKDLVLDEINLQEESKTLDEVLVKGGRVPVVINGDTIEYNADAFKTQPNAVVEDLLKRLPGVEVERDGTIRAQGEQVNQVLVDGKEFFGNDPKVATKNLPADAIDKVQVYDRKSDRAEFSGVDDGQRQKTINLSLKEDKKKGAFGRVTGGAGTDERYYGKANINRFSPEKQFSIIGTINNINEQGFSMNDYFNFSGGMQRMMSGGGGGIRIELNSDEMAIPIDQGNKDGLFTTWAGGVNFNNEISKQLEINGSYFFSQLNQDIRKTIRSENFLSDRTLITDEKSLQSTERASHRLNLSVQYKPDSLQEIRFRTGLSFNQTDFQQNKTSSTSLGDGILENTGLSDYASKGDNTLLNGSLMYRRKLGRPGRVFSLGMDLGVTDKRSDGRVNSLNQFGLSRPTEAVFDTLHQENNQANIRLSYGFNASYTEPLDKNKFLEANYSFSNYNEDIERIVYDLFGPAMETQFRNDLLSFNYDNAYIYHRGGFNFRLNRKKFNFSTGLNLQQSLLRGDLSSQGVMIKQSYLNLVPNLRWNYDISLANHLRFDYDAFVREPDIQQLQPTVDNTDPLNIYIGNPNLRPEYSNNLRLSYTSYDQITLSSFFAFFNATYTNQTITNAVSFDDRLVRTTTPINLKNNQRYQANFSYSSPIRPLKMRMNIGADLTYNQGFNLVGSDLNRTRQYRVRPNLRLENRFKEKFDLAVGAKVGFNETRYTLNKEFNQSFVNQTYFADLTIPLPAGFNFNSTLDYDLYRDRGAGFDQDIPLWNIALKKFFMATKQLELKFTVFDALNQNVGINRMAEQNYLRDERIESIGRYFMLSLTYNLSAFGGQGGIFIEQHR